ncbi:ubiquitin carboxyl-terminal hydrolase 43 [Anopheles ziemanni]|uniref:ubiquitin carboxyl-terminal hydrolase 43 n=1 Tax=Anopheles coustani TaxID=139045 RepID=UPI0026593009|nr:ubiquitin carboxyl-terminal hydrolase 43 [Anopheles coustani]XP_058168110.1 ubiquitin carboxyl-terminal hydrolase 43 [Anopheles ziemanni]
MENYNAQEVSPEAVPAESSTRIRSSKLKRAFSMPRNPFQGSRSSTPKVSNRLGGGYSNDSEAAASKTSNGDGDGSNNSKNVTSDVSSATDTSRLYSSASSGQHDGAHKASSNSNNKLKTTSVVDEMAGPRDGEGEGVAGHSDKKIFRRLSVKKFINRIAQQMTYVNRTVNNHKFDRVQSSQKATLNGSVARAGGNGAESAFVWPPDTVPGVIGLRNHGNTCFMNAVLQCLSHTDILAQYFVLDLYKADLKRRNKINAKKFGTKGELTEQLALVLKSLWTCKDAPDYSSNFKAVVDRYGSQFRSSTQHDAQEFLFWLLDKVHEDLNTATKRKYKTIKNNGRSDEVIAAETLANYVRCNNSFVQAVFQAQFRSSLSCPTCGKQSNTFDPFYCLSVPLPQLSQQPVLVKVIYASQQPKQVKLGLGIPHGSPVLALREQLHADTGIGLDRMILTEICETGFNRVLCDSHLMSSVHENDPLYCIECPAGLSAGQQDASSGTKILLLLCNGKRVATGSNDNGCVKRFGTPFCLIVNRDISYSELQKLLLKEMSSILRSDVFTFATPAQNLFRMRLQDPSCDVDTWLETTVEHPLFTEMIDLALSVLPSDAGPAHVKLLIEWTEPERFFSDMSDAFVEHESVCQMKEKIPASSTLTLEQCFEHYTKAETLGQDNAWKCPHCQEYLPVVKTLGLWSLPDIMVIHLKRFRQQQLRSSTQAAKLTNLVKFPLCGFDMTPHLVRDLSLQKTPGPQANAALNQNQHRGYSDSDSWSPWRKIKRSGHSIQSHSTGANAANGRRQFAMDNRYDLYAVCYHQGDTLETGHYTAACKNPYDGQWYRFDDQRVAHVPNDSIDEEIINNEAYLLFYQRRKLPTNTGEGATGECSGSSSSSSGDHWVSKIIVPPPVNSHAATAVSATIERSIKSTLSNSTAASSSSTTTTASIPETENKSPAASIVGESNKNTLVDTKSTADSDPPVLGSADKPLLETLVEVQNGLHQVNNSCTVVKKQYYSQDGNRSSIEKRPILEVKKPILDTYENPDSISPNLCIHLPASLSSAVTIALDDDNAKEAKESLAAEEMVIEKLPLQQFDTTTTHYSGSTSTSGTDSRILEVNDLVSKEPFSVRLEKLDRMVDHKLGGNISSVVHSTGGRFSLPSSQQYQDILWRENVSELIHHRPSSFATYKNVIDANDAVSLIRGANTCSKDTLLFIDQQGHGLDRVMLDDGDDDPDELLPGSGSRTLWISPVTPHKLITVSPKN